MNIDRFVFAARTIGLLLLIGIIGLSVIMGYRAYDTERYDEAMAFAFCTGFGVAGLVVCVAMWVSERLLEKQ